jgi:Fe-S cluster assembly protein SufD
MNCTVTRELEPYVANFAALEKRLNGARGTWIHSIRKAAIQRFLELGFPTVRDEEWIHTDVGPLTRIAFAAAPPPSAGTALTTTQVHQHLFADLPGCTLVFVNGRFVPTLSTLCALPPGVELGGLAEALAAGGPVEQHLTRHLPFGDHAFLALNTAFVEDGAFLRVPKGKVVTAPIHLLFLSSTDGTPTASHPRVLVLAEEGSQVSVIESYAGFGAAPYFTNAATEVVVGPSATVNHYKVQREEKGAFHMASLQARVEGGGRFVSYSMALGGGIARTEVNALLDGEGAECTMNGLYVLDGRQLVDSRTFVDHAKPHCTSNQLYKGILTGHSRGVFNGRVLVRKDAQKTDAHQTNKNMLLSEDALVDTKPQLEIRADDVRCTHGATIGQLQEDAVFYLRSRGIDAAAARTILTQAFAREVLSRIELESVHFALDCLLVGRMAGIAAKEASA